LCSKLAGSEVWLCAILAALLSRSSGDARVLENVDWELARPVSVG
jgi:hypothetical protein